MTKYIGNRITINIFYCFIWSDIVVAKFINEQDNKNTVQNKESNFLLYI